MDASPQLVIALVGYTKSRKSTAARFLQRYADFTPFEMSELLRTRIRARASALTVRGLVNEVRAFRGEEGPDILARRVAERILRSGCRLAVVAGVRCYDDHAYFARRFRNYRAVFLHTTTELRHVRLRNDPTSIAKTDEDFDFLDRQARVEEIHRIIPEVDFLVVNEPGFPLTLLEQLEVMVTKLRDQMALSIPWHDERHGEVTARTMSQEGFSIHKLPVFEGELPSGAPVLNRLLKDKGELSTISVSPMSYLAFVDFPADGEPRANHFHEEKEEFLYLIKGRLRGYFRRGNLSEEDPQVVDIESGSIVRVLPGWAHGYVALEDGYGVEFSPTPYEVIARDKVRDHVAPTGGQASVDAHERAF